jgi:CheY-like chemotaxis protein
MAFSSAGKYRLLAVDDVQDAAELIVRTALRCGYESLPALDAKTLRDILPHWRPNIITLDLCLPDVDGFELISSLKSVEFKGELLIISGQPEWFRKQAVQFASISGLRVTAHLPKPIDVAELRDLLTTMKANLSLTTLNQFGSKADTPQKLKA